MEGRRKGGGRFVVVCVVVVRERRRHYHTCSGEQGIAGLATITITITIITLDNHTSGQATRSTAA